MKTNFKKIDNRWVVETGYLVAVDYVRISGDDYDTCMAVEVIDVCTGIIYGLNDNHLIEEIYYEEVKLNNRKANKKSRRRERINNFVGVHWTQDTKRIGKNRRYARRLYPNKDQILEFGSYLPF